MVFMPNITTNHAITNTNSGLRRIILTTTQACVKKCKCSGAPRGDVEVSNRLMSKL